MWNEYVNVGALQPVAFQKLLAKLCLLAHGELENLLPILMDVMHFLRNRVFARRMQTAPARHVQVISPRSVHLMDEVDEPLGVILRRLENRRASPVPKKDAGRTVGVIDN